MTALALPLTDNGHLRRRVRALAENRPAVYRMIDAANEDRDDHLRSPDFFES